MEGLTEKQYNELVEKFGKDAVAVIEKKMAEAHTEAEKITRDALKGMITEGQFNDKMKDAVDEVKKELEKLENIAKEQGTEINAIKENTQKPVVKTLEDVLKEKAPEIKALYSQGMGNVEIDLKTAGITSIGNTIQPMTPAPNSPWLPGAGGPTLEMFGIIYNPNFILNYISRGRTNLSYLPWANETSVEGAATAVQEGAPKPLWNTRFKVEFSTAKKIAAMTVITEEFDQDLPGFTTIVERLLKEEVLRRFDDAIYAGVIAAATGYSLPNLNYKIDKANLWDALLAGFTQVEVANYNPNLGAVNPVSYAEMLMTKTEQTREYNWPPYMNRLPPIARSNKVAYGKALVGDFTQYKVDIYKDLMLKVGWNNDDFQRNQFSVIAELRYHDYISSTRKNALVYYDLATVIAQITSGS
jgi:hypothetical protein